MLGGFGTFLAFSILAVSLAIPPYKIGKPALAIGVAMAIATLAPTWAYLSVGGANLDARISIAGVMLTAFCLHRNGRFRFPVVWLDVVVVVMFFVACCSDAYNDGFDYITVLRNYGEFVLPFFAGRFFSMRHGSLREATPWFVGISIALGLGSAFEAFSGVNCWDLIFANVDDVVRRSHEKRFGLLYRASGPTRHPIFLGIVFLLLIPWSIALFFRGSSKRNQVLGGVGIACCFMGILATVSRGPLVCLVVAGVFGALLTLERFRLWILGSVIIGAVAAFFSWGWIIELAESTQDTDVQRKVVVVNGEPELYSGTRNRLWVVNIYGPLVLKGGPLGHGTYAVSSFPPRLSNLPVAAKDAVQLGIVDNSYILIGLRYGYLGVGTLVVLLGGAIYMACSLQRSAGLVLYPDGPAFLVSVASILLAVCVEIATVFSSFEFMFWIYFNCGVVAGLVSLRTDLLRGRVFHTS